ncbi:hypothetical protein BN11_640004 [Nostocoides australiense Ben110]|uniref:Uncharacterized protein n=1 Tax=Nostocoides australiense Ben110 TaxID=1193182 RepID=W6K088_9MICO|nr:hypothetical protein BN11_640004 [Tetrasphaera australiensis Ben110]
MPLGGKAGWCRTVWVRTGRFCVDRCMPLRQSAPDQETHASLKHRDGC